MSKISTLLISSILLILELYCLFPFAYTISQLFVAINHTKIEKLNSYHGYLAISKSDSSRQSISKTTWTTPIDESSLPTDKIPTVDGIERYISPTHILHKNKDASTIATTSHENSHFEFGPPTVFKILGLIYLSQLPSHHAYFYQRLHSKNQAPHKNINKFEVIPIEYDTMTKK